MLCRLPLVMLLVAAPALAQTQVYRLSPAQRDAAIEAGAGAPETAALLPDPARERILGNSLYPDDAPPRDRAPHGEFGVYAGTGGTQGAFGTIIAPLGETGSARFSFDIGSGRGYGYPYGASRFPYGASRFGLRRPAL